MKKRVSKNIKVFVSLAVLAGLLVSMIFPPQTAIQAETVKTNLEEKAQTINAGYGKMPLIFEKNKGQTDRQAKFLARGKSYALYLAPSEAVFSLKTANSKTVSDILRMQFVGANRNSEIEGLDEAVTKTNYYIGKKKFENVSNYRKVIYKKLYDGIDAVFYGNANNQLEYDFTVAPNADANQIELNFDGAENVSIDDAGNLVLKTENSELVQQKPFAYQIIEGENREVEARYVVDEQSQISFSLGEYDHSKPLTIDPVLTYQTYVGGSGGETTNSIAVDAAGNAYISGATISTDFPSPDARPNNGEAAFVAKLNSTGSELLYLTLLDGEGIDGDIDFVFGQISGTDVAVDANGNAYVTGITDSNDFPTTTGAYRRRKSLGCVPITVTCYTGAENHDAFVTKLDASGQISYSTYLGGRQQESANGIAVDSEGRAYVTGITSSGVTFPKKNDFQGTGVYYGFDAFLTVFNAEGSDLIYSTGFGGNSSDQATDIALDSANNAYIIGETDSNSAFPTKNAFQDASGGGTDAFIAKFNPHVSGENSLIYSTFLGGSGTDIGFGIAVNSGGQAHVTGITGSLNFPLKNAIDTTNQINEAFVAVYSASGAQLHSTFLGGADQEQGNSIAVGNGGTIYVVGVTLSDNFPLAVPFQAVRAGKFDTFVTKLRLGGNAPGVSSSTYIGGSENDFGSAVAVRGAHIFVAGDTSSTNLTTVSPDPLGPVKAASNGGDGFVSKILDTRKETVGTYGSARTSFSLKNTLAGGASDITVERGALGDVAVAGDFNGDGIDTASTFNGGVWKIFNFNAASYGAAPITSSFGLSGDLPIVGDWDGDGVESLGTYRRSNGRFFLSNAVQNPQINFQITFGLAEDFPVAGDWDGDGIDTVGVFRPSAGQFFLTNDNVPNPNIDFVATFGTSGDLPVAGDWDGDGKDSVGVWRPSTREFFLSNDNINIANQFVFGTIGDRPVVGDWDGKPNQ
jgi:Beta-propeller repeat